MAEPAAAVEAGPSDAELLIEVDHVVLGYDGGRTILNDVSLSFGRGKVTAILAGYAWDKSNPLVFDARRSIAALDKLCDP